MTQPICSLSLDLDNQWSYMKTHGDAGWEKFPSYLDLVTPRILEVLKSYGWTITVFVVGQDAALDRNKPALRLIAEAGHEIGNHSFHHEPWLQLYTRRRVEDELTRAHEAIEDATGVAPSGFRGPGYTMSPDTLVALARLGYRYDASTFPTFLGPLARAYYFLTSDFSAEEKERRRALFGGLKDGLRPNRPYLWNLGGDDLLEIPVTTLPLVKIPFHFSYLLYLSTVSPTLAMMYFKTALVFCRWTRTEPSLLLHPLDFLGGDDVAELAFFPAMKMGSSKKLDTLHRMFRLLSRHRTVVNLDEHASRIRQLATLKSVLPV